MRRWNWLAGALLIVACGGSTVTDAASPPPADTSTSVPAAVRFRGADISALERIELAGAHFRNGNQVGDVVALLRADGINLFRLRLFVSPNQQEVQVNDLEYSVRLAKRVRASGASLMLDLHFSDTWADPGHQLVPAAWSSLGFEALELQVESYTRGVITRLKSEGALPDIVQIGNEIDAGMLWPMGHVGGTNDVPQQWERFTRLLKAGIRGVRADLSPGDSVRVLLHYSSGGSSTGTQWFFDHIGASGVPYDLIGVSYYPWWHGSVGDLETNLRLTAERYGRDVMVVETSYPWRAGGWESLASSRSAMVWGVSKEGQAQFIRDLRGVVSRVPGGRGAGVIWWYPEAVPVPGLFVWGGGSLALFDDGGSILPAAATLGTH